jgi:hypothetical protein
VDQSTLSNNTATGLDTTFPNLPSGGGGLFAVGGSVSVTNSLVSGNTASHPISHPAYLFSGGAGIAVEDGANLALTDSTCRTAPLHCGGGRRLCR